MRRLKRSRALALSAAVAALLVTSFGTGPAAAQEPDEPAATEAAPAAPSAAADVEAAQSSTTRYGPYNLTPPPPNPDGSHGHAHTGNQFQLGIQKPCNNCYITGMQADLVDANGNSVGVSDNVMLHHMVLFNQNDGRTDATCQWGVPFPLGGLFGQRFFASGDERTPLDAPPGYGYRVGNGTFNMIYELMTMSSTQETVYIEMSWDWVPEAQAGNMVDLEPVWMDVDQCGFSEVAVPAGPSTKSWTWNVNRPGKIVGIGGHVHSGGINIDIRNETTGRRICDSRAGYGETPMYVDHHGEEWLSSMSFCGGAADPAFDASVATNDRVTITGHYNQPEPVDDQMAIVIAYIAQEEAPNPDCNWLLRLFGLC